MKLIIKYLKPFTIGVILSLAFLFIQARMDLSLPNYMSDIINVGIQQGGITEAAPKVVSENGYRLMTVFMTSSDKQVVAANYKLIKMGDISYTKTYSLVKTSNIYVLKNKTNILALNKIFGHATATMMNFARDMNKTPTTGSNTTAVDFKKIYLLLPTLEKLPTTAFDKSRTEADKLQVSLQNQMATSLTKKFYQEAGVNTDAIQTDYIVNKGLMMLVLALVGGISAVVVGFYASRIAARVAQNMRHDVFEKVTSFANTEFEQFGASSLITRTTNDITQVQSLVFLGIRILCYAPILGIGGVMMALQKSNSMSWIIALAIMLLIGVIIAVFIIAMPKFKVMQKLIDKLNLVARENLSGILVIRAFGSEKFEEKRFNKANTELADNGLFIGRVMALMMPIVTLIMSLVILLIVWVGSHQIANSTMQIGDMMAFMQYTMQIIMAFIMITIMFIMVPRAAVSLKRIKEVLDTDASIKDPIEPKEFIESKRGLVEFKNVTFKYKDADENVLCNISFTAKPGKTTAFIGSTGSGKSTLVNLIPRFYDVNKGKILVNGVDIKDVKQATLHDVIGYIPQKGVLLSGTIDSNIRYGKKDATIDEMNEASVVAQASDFINKLKNKYDAPIAQAGANVSGGQKQRLSIARALVKKPDIYIFDDSFSSLDFKTDANLRLALKKYTKAGTVLIVAQRISTIMNADQIIVLNQGKIVGSGTHKELLKSCPTYLEIATSQLSKEEL